MPGRLGFLNFPFLSTLSLRRATLSGSSRATVLVFLSTLSLRRATGAYRGARQSRRHFYPRSPCGERRRQLGGGRQVCHHFYPRSPCGERHRTVNVQRPATKFLSTLSLRRATALRQLQSALRRNFYPRSPCGERRAKSWHCASIFKAISIHALLAESDWARGSRTTYVEISIHALLAESDEQSSSYNSYLEEFLSTLSLRRATILVFCGPQGSGNFYPRSPCGERLAVGR